VAARTFGTIDDLQSGLLDASYLADRGLASVLFLALKLEKPVLLEGEAGVGKTEAAKAMARVLPARLIRLQCYEGLDVAHAVYEWNYSRQLLHIRAAQEGTVSEEELFGPEFLIRRPLLEAIESETRSTAPTTSSRRSCSKSCRTSRSPSPSSEPSRRSGGRS
jgi:MoxR-like ATPase